MHHGVVMMETTAPSNNSKVWNMFGSNLSENTIHIYTFFDVTFAS